MSRCLCDNVHMQHDIAALALGIKDMGALVSLSLARNDLGVEGAKHIAEILPNCGALASLDLSNNKLTRGKLKPGRSGRSGNFAKSGNAHDDSDFETDTSGIAAFAEAMKDMGALASFDISNNAIGGQQKTKIKRSE